MIQLSEPNVNYPTKLDCPYIATIPLTKVGSISRAIIDSGEILQ